MGGVYGTYVADVDKEQWHVVTLVCSEFQAVPAPYSCVKILICSIYATTEVQPDKKFSVPQPNRKNKLSASS